MATETESAPSAAPSLSERLRRYALLVRLHRPIGTFLLLWPCLWALWIAAEGVPDPLVLGVFVLGTFLMRSAGCAINDFADREIDPHVARTSERPLAAGLVTPREALYVAAGLSLLAFLLVLLMNPLTIALSVVAVLLAATYPFAKRYTHLPQIHLGAAFGWAVPMAFAAQAGSLPPVAWLLYLAAILWATIYDTMYAMADRPEDLKIGVKSTAILFGDADLPILALLQGLFVVTLAVVGHQAGLGWPFVAGLLVAVGFMVYHQRLIAGREPAQCFRAFLNNNWLGLAVTVGVIADYALRTSG
ncbi:MAG: 4-hydroxybenzoate octaprenyltransferase [Gammaproteobacteria bacterium]|nr:4-hydroxybenzoate octaprenyltransferase [Gammaproteobacteria bacterium]